MTSTTAGFVKIHRRILNHPALRDPGMFKFWVELILRAGWEDGQYVNLERGQLAFSTLDYCREHGVTEKWVRHRIAQLIAEGMIETKRIRRGVIITITNYNIWQSPDDGPIKTRSKTGANKRANKRANIKTSEARANPDLFDGPEDARGEQKGEQKGERNKRTIKKVKKDTPYRAGTAFGDAPPTPDAILYRVAREHFGDKAAPIITKLKRYHTVEQCHDIVKLAMSKDQPIRYLAAIVRRREKDKANGKGRDDNRTIEQSGDGTYRDVANAKGSGQGVRTLYDAFGSIANETEDQGEL